MPTTCIHCHGAIVDGVCEDCGKPARKQSLVTASTGGLDAMDAASTAPLTTGRTSNSSRFTVNYPTRPTVKGATKPTRRRAGISAHTSTRRNALGGGLISLPDLPSQDPLALLMKDPEVPAHKRHCPKCDQSVNRVKGFCPACGTAYNFMAGLKMGDVVAGKYEIKGPIAFGGLGWIYLGWDQVLQRWVVLKGLLNTNDAASAAAAVAERRYLAAVKHPKIVAIYDFVQHGSEGFIIMEYVGGQTVHSLRKKRGPLPVAEAVAYILGVIPAFSYLHDQGLVYCDFKPDNIMLEGGDVKLIDMGAVRKAADPDGDIYATKGFAAPEADSDPSALSDLYTLGRALAVLIADFRFSSEFEHTLPPPDHHQVLAENESLYRFLLRATHADPDERFQNADEMAEQLFGVLREIVALQSGPKPADSRVFTGDRLVDADVKMLITEPDPLSLPALRVNLEDRGAKEVIRILSMMDPEQQADELQQLMKKYGDRATEPRLRLAEVLIHHPQVWPDRREQAIGMAIGAVETADPFDWRASWFRGLWQLKPGNGALALPHFERCYFEMPGELAPRLAMGVAAEMAGNTLQALPYYDRVGQVDPSYVSASFGAARCLAKAGRVLEAVAMLQRVPTSHSIHAQALLAIAEVMLTYQTTADVALLQKANTALLQAMRTKGLNESHEVAQIAGRTHEWVVGQISKISWPPGQTLLEIEFEEPKLRSAAEEWFRQAAHRANSKPERFYWVERANQVRPFTWF